MAPRLIAQLTTATNEETPRPLCAAETWGDTYLNIDSLPTGSWQHLLTGAATPLQSGRLEVGPLFADFPIIVLVKCD